MTQTISAILVASDLSERSEPALARAIELAGRHGARLTVVHIVDEDLPKTVREQAIESARTCLSAALSENGSAAALKAEIRTEAGDPSQDILRIARELDVDLLVLGVHRMRPLMDMFTGTTVERLVRSSERPVLLARSSAAPYQRALIGVDLSPACAAAARVAARVAPQAALHGVFAYHAPFKGLRDAGLAPGYRKDAERELDAWLETANLPEAMPKPELFEGSVHQGFDHALTNVKPDLIALGAHGRPMFDPTLLGSFTEEMMRRPPCDLLVVRR